MPGLLVTRPSCCSRARAARGRSARPLAVLPILPGNTATARAPDPGPSRALPPCARDTPLVRTRAPARGRGITRTLASATRSHARSQSVVRRFEGASGWGCPERSRCSIAGSIGNTASGPRRTVPLRAPDSRRRARPRRVRPRRAPDSRRRARLKTDQPPTPRDR